MGVLLDFSVPLAPRRKPGRVRSEGFDFRSETHLAQPGSLSLDVFDGERFIGFISFRPNFGDVVAWSADREHITACPDLQTAFATVRALDQRGRQ